MKNERDSNLKRSVNMVNLMNFFRLAGFVLRERAGKEEEEEITFPSPPNKFTKFISSPGFLRFESGFLGGVLRQIWGVRGEIRVILAKKRDARYCVSTDTREYIEHLLTYMIARRVFAMGLLETRPQKCELLIKV